MIIMLIIIGVIFGGIFGYKEFQSYMMKKYMAAGGASEVTVSTTKAVMEEWQPEISAVGSLRAFRGVDISSEVTGIVQTVNIKSGDNVRTGQTILQLNADSDVAKLHTLLAAAIWLKACMKETKNSLLPRQSAKHRWSLMPLILNPSRLRWSSRKLL